MKHAMLVAGKTGKVLVFGAAVSMLQKDVAVVRLVEYQTVSRKSSLLTNAVTIAYCPNKIKIKRDHGRAVLVCDDVHSQAV